MPRLGVLSDTHLASPDDAFRRQVAACFGTMDLILHAGDVTDLSVLDVFDQERFHGVCGNMCNHACRTRLPARKTFTAFGVTFGLIHDGGSIERMMDLFPEAEVIVFGHTHVPCVERYGGYLFVNPGSFRAGSYAVIEIDPADGIQAMIREVPA